MTDNQILNALFQAQNVSHAAILLSNEYEDSHGKYASVVALGENRIFSDPIELDYFQGIAVGHISYQFKNTIEFILKTPNLKETTPLCMFFEPQKGVFISRDGSSELFGGFEFTSEQLDLNETFDIGRWQETTPKEDYLNAVEQIRNDIRYGVYYELNYCISFSAFANLNPYLLFYYFNQLAPSPFAAFYKLKDQYLLCASPERFLMKSGQSLMTQPIKGTRKRIPGKEKETIAELKDHPKDLAENKMIVDLVRNDLSRICKPSTVLVPELCEIHTFSHVHQMISTVVGELEQDVKFHNIIEAVFPMGSMTGAPKIEVMKHIDLLEDFHREFYSGCVGYMKDGDFDFNVVIRSLEYRKNQLKYCVGGAITYDSIAEEEYEECLTKASGIMNLLEKVSNSNQVD